MIDQELQETADGRTSEFVQATQRQTYQAPRLRLLGRVRDLTASGSKTGKENKGNVHGNKP